MSGKRSSPPLFEVLSRQGGTPDASAPSTRQAPSTREVHPAVLRDAAEPPPPGRISVPITAVYAFVSASLLLAVVVWVIAYNIGFGRGEQQTLREFGLIGPELGELARGPDPLATNERNRLADADTPPLKGQGNGQASGRTGGEETPDNIGTERPQPSRTDRAPETAAETGTQSDQTPSRATATASLIGPGGALAQDPREGGLNYLKLASGVPRPEATELVAFLTDRGMPALAVMVRPGSVDSGGGATNDSDRFDLYAIDLAVPGARFSAMRSQRERLQEQAARLGSQWRRERQGTVDLARTNWELYRPD